MTQSPENDPSPSRDQAQEFTTLVAITVRAPTREAAERALHSALPHPWGQYPAPVECWWIAEDERHDGSDCDSAVFVNKGSQDQAAALLARHHLAAPTH